MNNFELAVLALTAAVIESLPNATDYLTVKCDVMIKLRQDAQRSEGTRLNSSHRSLSRMPSSA